MASPSSCELDEDIDERFNNPENESAGVVWDAVSVRKKWARFMT
jgi:hypothetical protein